VKRITLRATRVEKYHRKLWEKANVAEQKLYGREHRGVYFLGTESDPRTELLGNLNLKRIWGEQGFFFWGGEITRLEPERSRGRHRKLTKVGCEREKETNSRIRDRQKVLDEETKSLDGGGENRNHKKECKGQAIGNKALIKRKGSIGKTEGSQKEGAQL